MVAAGSLVERFPSGAAFVLPPFVFRQANLDAFDAIVAQVVAAVPLGARVVEWYAGVGVLGASAGVEPEALHQLTTDLIGYPHQPPSSATRISHPHQPSSSASLAG